MKTRDDLLKAALEAGPERIEAALAAIRGEGDNRQRQVGTAQGLLDVAATCNFLGGISRTSLWRLRRNGLRSVKVGGRRCFRRSDLDAAIEKMVEEG